MEPNFISLVLYMEVAALTNYGKLMFKHVLIAVAVTGLIAVALPVEASAAKAGAAGQMTCKEAAKHQFPNERKMRKAFKIECKNAYKGRTTAT